MIDVDANVRVVEGRDYLLTGTVVVLEFAIYSTIVNALFVRSGALGLYLSLVPWPRNLFLPAWVWAFEAWLVVLFASFWIAQMALGWAYDRLACPLLGHKWERIYESPVRVEDECARFSCDATRLIKVDDQGGDRS